MKPDVTARLRELARRHVVRVEYQCASCGYLLYRRFDRGEVERLPAEDAAGRPLLCPACEDRNLVMVAVSTEKEWTREHADHTHGG